MILEIELLVNDSQKQSITKEQWLDDSQKLSV